KASPGNGQRPAAALIAAAPPAPSPNNMPTSALAPSSNGNKQAEVESRAQMFAILEIDPSGTLSVELIRRHYTRLMAKFAPERVHDLGDEFVATAERKRREIEHAARVLIAPWNEELVPKDRPQPTQDLRHNPDLDAL